MEAWVGVELEMTDIYGMRRYEDGARLLTHVDRVNTHAASLIINVAQEAIREPWMVEIYDFAGRSAAVYILWYEVGCNVSYLVRLSTRGEVDCTRWRWRRAT